MSTMIEISTDLYIVLHQLKQKDNRAQEPNAYG